MPYAVTPDDVKLYYEEVGQGTPILFVHEFAGDHRSWESQLRNSENATAASRMRREVTSHRILRPIHLSVPTGTSCAMLLRCLTI